MPLPAPLAPYADQIRAATRRALRLSRHPDPPRPWQSQLGGQVPYWPADFVHPRSEQGRLLTFLAQVNFAEIPPLPDFPTHGLLQLFLNRQGSFTVVGHYVVDVITDENALLPASAIAELLRAETYGQTAPDPLPEIKQPGRLAFAPITVVPDPTDYAFARAFGANSPLNAPPPYTQPDHARHAEQVRHSPYHLYRNLAETGLTSTLGGYGRFPQHDDPRTDVPGTDVPRTEVADADWLVLLKLMADDVPVGSHAEWAGRSFRMLWGDVQELHVFIRRAALRQADFSDLWLYLAV